MKPGIFTYIIAAIMLMFAFYIVPLSWNNMMLHSGTPDSVLGNSGLTAQFIDNVLCTYNSPACHTGADMIDAGWHHDVSPSFALAFFWQSSNFGKVNCGTPSATCIRYHGSWKETYDDWYETISGPLYKGSGVVSVQDIVAKSNVSHSDDFAKNVVAAVALWKKGTVSLP